MKITITFNNQKDSCASEAIDCFGYEILASGALKIDISPSNSILKHRIIAPGEWSELIVEYPDSCGDSA